MLVVHVYMCTYAPQAISHATLTCLPKCLEHHRYIQSDTTANTAVAAEQTTNTSSKICWYHGMLFSGVSRYASPCVQAACSIKPAKTLTVFTTYAYFLHCLCVCASMTQCQPCQSSTSSEMCCRVCRATSPDHLVAAVDCVSSSACASTLRDTACAAAQLSNALSAHAYLLLVLLQPTSL